MNEYIRQLIGQEKARQAEQEQARHKEEERVKAERTEQVRAEWVSVRAAICAAIPEAAWLYLMDPEPEDVPGYQAHLELQVEGLAPIEAWVQRGKSAYEFKTFHVKGPTVKLNGDQPPRVQWAPNRSYDYGSLPAALVAAEQQRECYTELQAEIERQNEEKKRSSTEQMQQAAKKDNPPESPAPYIADVHEIALLEALRQFVRNEISDY